MPEAYIYDHVRTPRGRGKSSGALHEVTPIELLTQMLRAMARAGRRNYHSRGQAA